MTLHDSVKEKILAALRGYHGGNVYLMSSSDLVDKGFALYHDNEVLSIEWDKNFVCLHVRIGQSGRVVVTARIVDDQLVFSCTCSRENKETGCEHIVCAVLALKNLLLPDVFQPKSPNPLHRRALLAGLCGASRKISGKISNADYFIVLERNYAGVSDVYVAMGGERLTKVVDIIRSPVPELAADDLNFMQKINALIGFLRRKRNKYPVIIRREGKDSEAEFDTALFPETFTELALSHGEVSVIKGLRDQDLRILEFVLFGELAYFPETGKMAVIENLKGWEPWRAFELEIKKVEHDGYEYDLGQGIRFTIPLSRFESIQHACLARVSAIGKKDILFTLNGKKSWPAPIVLEPRMTILLPEENAGTAILRAECTQGAVYGPIDFRRFLFFEDLTLLLFRNRQAKKSKEALVRAFYELLDATTDVQAEKIIRRALDDGKIVKREMRNSIRRLLQLHRRGKEMDDEQVFVWGDEWRIARHDNAREALMYRVLYEVFGWELFDSVIAANTMRVSTGLLQDRLPLLSERFSHHGIGLFLKGKPVRQARWEFALIASRKADIDWFEIRPEIRCDGKLLDDISLDTLLADRGVVEKDDFIQILDANSHKVLERIAAVYRSSKETGRNEREPVHIPKLRILDWAALRNSGVVVRLPPEDEVLIERLLNFKKIDDKSLPEGLQATLRPYQREGYSWLAFLYEHRLGACLADDMGLGKTVQAISLLGGIHEGIVESHIGARGLPHLIVVPPSLVFNWEQELSRFYPRLKVHIYTGSERSDDFDKFGVVLTTYGTARKDIEKLKDRQFHTIVFDEAQTIKNIYADTTGAVRRLRGFFKITMTGTPVENHLGEYYSIVDLAVPGLLGEYDQFRPLIKSGTAADLDVIIGRTRPFVLRRTKEAVLTDLPSKTEIDIYLDMTEEQKALYQKTVEQARKTVDEAYRTKIASQARIIALTAILKLRQICISPRLLDRALAGASPKMDFLIERLRELMDENHSTLVFSQFTSVLDILGESLRRGEIGYLRLDGSTPRPKRKTLVEQFQASDRPSVFLLSLKAGGQGLNLTRASYVFHLDPWWNPAVESQASDRAHRIGQKNKVTITRLLMRHTIEEKMMELKKRKRTLYDALLSENAMNNKGAAITRDDFVFLLDSAVNQASQNLQQSLKPI
jgi:superfamily II DNA or RNA helicase